MGKTITIEQVVEIAELEARIRVPAWPGLPAAAFQRLGRRYAQAVVEAGYEWAITPDHLHTRRVRASRLMIEIVMQWLPMIETCQLSGPGRLDGKFIDIPNAPISGARIMEFESDEDFLHATQSGSLEGIAHNYIDWHCVGWDVAQGCWIYSPKGMMN